MGKELSTSISVPVSATLDRLWEALTNPEIIKQYFFGTQTETTWEPGSPVTFSGEWQGQSYNDKGTVIACDPKRLLSYTFWSSMSGIEDKPENYMTINFHIDGSDQNLLLTLTQENIPNEQTKNHSEANWKKVLNDMKKIVEA